MPMATMLMPMPGANTALKSSAERMAEALHGVDEAHGPSSSQPPIQPLASRARSPPARRCDGDDADGDRGRRTRHHARQEVAPVLVGAERVRARRPSSRVAPAMASGSRGV